MATKRTAGRAARGTETNPLATVIVACRGQLETTRLCLPRLFRHTPQPVEFALIDLDSLDGTADYLAGVAAAAAVPVHVHSCPSPDGLPGALDDAMATARGAFVAWVGNETLVTAGWLGGMVRLARDQPGAGLIGPVTSCGPRSQRAGDDPPWFDAAAGRPADIPLAQSSGDPAGLDDFAAAWCKAHRGEWKLVDDLSELCLLIRREALGALAPWGRLTHVARGPARLEHLIMDEICDRARHAGFALACAREVFVHSLGTRCRGEI